MNVLSLFSGIGGLDLAVKDVWPESRTVLFCETDEYCQKVLALRFPDTPIWGDVYDLQGSTFIKEGIEIDLITAGFPCQAFSHAGRRQGKADERGVLFWEITRLAGEIGEAQGRLPRLILENVTGLLSLRNDDHTTVFGEMLIALDEVGYDVRWGVVGACDVGAPHRRLRVFLYAQPKPLDTDTNESGSY